MTAQSGHVAVVEALVAAGADVDIADKVTNLLLCEFSGVALYWLRFILYFMIVCECVEHDPRKAGVISALAFV